MRDVSDPLQFPCSGLLWALLDSSIPTDYLISRSVLLDTMIASLTGNLFTTPQATAKGVSFPKLRSERTQGFAADPVYGRAKCLPMLGEIKT